jgi:hypothetical protein
MPSNTEEESKILSEIDRFLVFMYGYKFCEKHEGKELKKFNELCEELEKAILNSSKQFIMSPTEVLNSVLDSLQYEVEPYCTRYNDKVDQPQFAEKEQKQLINEIIELLTTLTTNYFPVTQENVEQICIKKIESFHCIDSLRHNEVILGEIIFPEITQMMNAGDSLYNTAVRVTNRYVREVFRWTEYGDEELNILKLALRFKKESDSISFELAKYYTWAEIYRSDRDVKKLFFWWITLTNDNYRKENNLSESRYDHVSLLKKGQDFNHGLNIAPKPTPPDITNYSTITNTLEDVVRINNMQLCNHAVLAIPFDKKINEMELELYLKTFMESYRDISEQFNNDTHGQNPKPLENYQPIEEKDLEDKEDQKSKQNFYVNYPFQVFKLLGGLYLYEKCSHVEPHAALGEILVNIEELLKKIDPSCKYNYQKDDETKSQKDGNERSIKEGYATTKKNIENVWKNLMKSKRKFRVADYH